MVLGSTHWTHFTARSLKLSQNRFLDYVYIFKSGCYSRTSSIYNDNSPQTYFIFKKPIFFPPVCDFKTKRSIEFSRVIFVYTLRYTRPLHQTKSPLVSFTWPTVTFVNLMIYVHKFNVQRSELQPPIALWSPYRYASLQDVGPFCRPFSDLQARIPSVPSHIFSRFCPLIYTS